MSTSIRDTVHYLLSVLQDKFISLALAFKTDKMTLEKRIELHERSRDIAEQNVGKELEGLNEALKVLCLFFLPMNHLIIVENALYMYWYAVMSPIVAPLNFQPRNIP